VLLHSDRLVDVLVSGASERARKNDGSLRTCQVFDRQPSGGRPMSRRPGWRAAPAAGHPDLNRSLLWPPAVAERCAGIKWTAQSCAIDKIEQFQAELSSPGVLVAIARKAA
jgi:hypothetical protein